MLVVAAAALVAQQTVFRVEVRLVRLLVTVKDDAGQLVGSLNREDFGITDNGVAQEIAVFDRQSSQPLSVALLVDESASTAKELQYELSSVRRFLRDLLEQGNPEDAVALYTFHYDVTLRASFTRRMARFEAALKQIKPEGGTSLYDAIYLASADLEERGGRHVMVIVTDGGDTTSSKDFHAALEAAHRADAAVYAVLVMPITNDPGRNIGGENALFTLATGTGGRVFWPSVGAALDAAFGDVLRDLRTQYLLAFYPKNVPPSKDRFHRLEVKLARPGLRAIARNGYYGDSQADPTPGSGAGPGPRPVP